MNISPTKFKIWNGHYIPFFEITGNVYRLHPCYIIKPFSTVRPDPGYFQGSIKVAPALDIAVIRMSINLLHQRMLN